MLLSTHGLHFKVWNVIGPSQATFLAIQTVFYVSYVCLQRPIFFLFRQGFFGS